MDIRELITALRKESGLSQNKFAYKCKIKSETIKATESGRNAPSAATVNKIADAMFPDNPETRYYMNLLGAKALGWKV